MDITTNLICPANLHNQAAVRNDEFTSEMTNTDCHPHGVADSQNSSSYVKDHEKSLFRRQVAELPPDNLANLTPVDLVCAATPGQAPTRSSGWTFELFNDFLSFQNCHYKKDIFGDDFYWQTFYQHFALFDIFFDWIATAYTKDEKYSGAGRIRQYLLPKEFRSLETFKLLGNRDFHDDGMVGYLDQVLRKYPIDSHYLRQLEEMFAGNELELDVDTNFDKLSEERREFYTSHTQKKKNHFFDNIYRYLKDNPYRLERDTALKVLISDFDRNGAGQPFHEYVLGHMDTLKKIRKYGTDITPLLDRSICECLQKLDDFYKSSQSALYQVGVASEFYVASRRHEQERH